MKIEPENVIDNKICLGDLAAAMEEHVDEDELALAMCDDIGT